MQINSNSTFQLWNPRKVQAYHQSLVHHLGRAELPIMYAMQAPTIFYQKQVIYLEKEHQICRWESLLYFQNKYCKDPDT